MVVRSIGKKIPLGFAIVCLPGMLVSLTAFIYFISNQGFQDMLSASAMATTLFFASRATVLYLISKPPRHNLPRM